MTDPSIQAEYERFERWFRVPGEMTRTEQGMFALIRRLMAEREASTKLLAVAECPAHCDNGVIPDQIAEDEWQPLQCQFCDERSALLKAIQSEKEEW